MMFQRDRQPEMMDAPGLTKDEHLRALAGLSRLNSFSGVAAAMYRHLRRHALAQRNRPLCVLDVGSGAGDVPLAWMRRAKREGLSMQLTMLDIHPLAVEEQKRRADELGLDILALQHDCMSSPLPGGFDVVTSSLFMHHLDDHQCFRLLQSMQAATDGGMVICDLERSRLNLALVQIGAHLLSRSPLVHYDAAASVRGAYTMDEFKKLAENALARPIRIERSFPCRFIAVFDEKTVIEAVPAFA